MASTAHFGCDAFTGSGTLLKKNRLIWKQITFNLKRMTSRTTIPSRLQSRRWRSSKVYSTSDRRHQKKKNARLLACWVVFSLNTRTEPLQDWTSEEGSQTLLLTLFATTHARNGAARGVALNLRGVKAAAA